MKQACLRGLALGIALLGLSVLLAYAVSYRDVPMNECAWCHQARGLDRHHVIPQEVAPELRDDTNNIVVLCGRCHFVLGHRCYTKQYNPDVLEIVRKHTNSLPILGKKL